jgi:hypothetical protein
LGRSSTKRQRQTRPKRFYALCWLTRFADTMRSSCYVNNRVAAEQSRPTLRNWKKW